MTSSVYPLFGGAITLNLPSGLIDASDLRQIPDTQEVFLSPDSDVTYIIEILQRVEPNDLSEAVKFHFDSLAHDNSAQSSTVERVIPPSLDIAQSATRPVPCLLQGTQLVQKFNRPSADEVRILVALYRIEDKDTDVVFTCNIPVETTNPETEAVANNEWPKVAQAFENAVNTFEIVDPSLFA